MIANNSVDLSFFKRLTLPVFICQKFLVLSVTVILQPLEAHPAMGVGEKYMRHEAADSREGDGLVDGVNHEWFQIMSIHQCI